MEAHAFVIAWRDAFKINVPQIDDEHRHLFDLVGRLEIATVSATLDELLTYVVTHFSHEQQLMEASGYPAFEEHLKLHEQFSVAVADFLGAGEGWTEERIESLRRFLNRWLIGHIMTHDLRFGNWYREHQGSASTAHAAPRKVAASAAQAPAAASVRKVGWFDRLLGRG